FQYALLERSDHALVHIAFAADRRRIREFVGGCDHRRANLLAAPVLAGAPRPTAARPCWRRGPPRAARVTCASVSSTRADARSMRKSFNEMLVPAISRKHVFTSCVVTVRTSPFSSWCWNSRRPGNRKSGLMALASRPAATSLVMIFPPFERNL